VSEETPSSSPRSRTLFLALLGLIAIVFLLALWVFRFFLLVFTVSAAMAIFLAPLNRRLRRAVGDRGGVSAGLLTVLTALVILVPVAGSATLLSRQALNILGWLRPRLQPEALQELWRDLPERYPVLQQVFDFNADAAAQTLSQAASVLVSFVNGLIQGTVAGLTTAIFDLVLFLMILFFLLRDGSHLGRELRAISPLSTEQESQLVEHLAQTVRGMLMSMVVVPVAQGIIAFVGFLIFGVPSPLFWGFMVSLAALIPLVGSPLGWLPACGYLFATGAATWQWLGMLVFGVAVISTSDNVIKPIVLRDAARIHPLLGFFAILGGLLSFGPLGVLVGPVILSLLLSAVRIYRIDVLEARDTVSPSGEEQRATEARLRQETADRLSGDAD
jgi:predicted PurR-regulated permease PerM